MKILFLFLMLYCSIASAKYSFEDKSRLLESTSDSVSQTEFLRRNPVVKQIAWTNTGKIYIYMKSGAIENYDLNNEEEVKKAEQKYGTLPSPRRKLSFSKTEGSFLGGDVYAALAIDVPPAYPNGKRAIDAYFKKNIDHTKKNGFSGLVLLTFVVEKDGSLSNVELARGISEPIDAEIIRVLKASGKWNPGIRKGEIVRTLYTLRVKV